MSYPRTKETAKPLFLLTTVKASTWRRNGIPDPDIVETYHATQETIDYLTKYRKDTKITDMSECNTLWPNDTVVNLKGSSYRNCYATASYEIVSSERLTESDLSVLRAQGCFMSGQETGICNTESYQEIDGKYIYSASSVCDSGD